MKKRLVTEIAAFTMVLGLITSPALAFQCPTLIKQANDALAKAKKLVDEAQRSHDTGQHAESVKKANEALLLLGVKKAQAESPPRKGSSY